MPKYIELEQAIDLFYPEDPENDGSDGCTTVLKSGNYTSAEIESMLSNLPAADVAPVVHAKWENCDWVEPYYHGCGTIRIPNAGMKCTNCVHVFKKDLLWKDNYCPNCGAKMDLKEDK